MTISLALYKRKKRFDLSGRLIRFWTKSDYSHCELVVDGMCFSSSIQDGGVRAKAIELRSDRWDWIDLPWASRNAIIAHWDATLGQPYDWWGLIGSQVFNRRPESRVLLRVVRRRARTESPTDLQSADARGLLPEPKGMTPTEIRAAIAADPAMQALVPDTVALAAALSVGRVRRRMYLATERTVVSTLGLIAGEDFLSALEAMAVSGLPAEHPLLPYQPGIARQLAWLKRDGLDVGDPQTRSMLDTLSSLELLDAGSVTAIKALGVDPDPVPEYDVRVAIFNPDGSLAV
jgi:hypothetical protein